MWLRKKFYFNPTLSVKCCYQIWMKCFLDGRTRLSRVELLPSERASSLKEKHMRDSTTKDSLTLKLVLNSIIYDCI